MLQKHVYEQFKMIFPQFEKLAEKWFPNGRNSVRVRLLDGREFAFTYTDRDVWRLETISSFIIRMKGGNR